MAISIETADRREHPPDGQVSIQTRAAHGTADQVTDLAGAALWLPPGVHPDDEALAALFEKSLTAERRGSLPLYERHGFEILATIQTESGPPIFPMLRAAR